MGPQHVGIPNGRERSVAFCGSFQTMCWVGFWFHNDCQELFQSFAFRSTLQDENVYFAVFDSEREIEYRQRLERRRIHHNEAIEISDVGFAEVIIAGVGVRFAAHLEEAAKFMEIREVAFADMEHWLGRRLGNWGHLLPSLLTHGAPYGFVWQTAVVCEEHLVAQGIDTRGLAGRPRSVFVSALRPFKFEIVKGVIGNGINAIVFAWAKFPFCSHIARQALNPTVAPTRGEVEPPSDDEVAHDNEVARAAAPTLGFTHDAVGAEEQVFCMGCVEGGGGPDHLERTRRRFSGEGSDHVLPIDSDSPILFQSCIPGGRIMMSTICRWSRPITEELPSGYCLCRAFSGVVVPFAWK